MLKRVFFVLGMIACGKHPVPQEVAGRHLGFAGENFSSTNSPCLDGILAAIDHSCAVPMEIEEGYPYVMIQCASIRAESPPWNEYNIIAITSPRIEDPAGATMLCVDPHTRVYMQKRP
jgi:hypothetical protein